MTDIGPTRFGEHYLFPKWADSLGWMIGTSTLAPFVFFAFYHYFIRGLVSFLYFFFYWQIGLAKQNKYQWEFSN